MEKTCQYIQEILPNLLAQTLSEQEAAELQRHITRCPACRRYLQVLESDDKLLSDFVEGMQPNVIRIQDHLMHALGQELKIEPVPSPSICKTVLRAPAVRFAIAASLILLFGLLAIPFLINKGHPAVETSPHYVLAEAQKDHSKETRPWDILPPLPK